ncbi:DEAD/DEAH box helicase family protein [Shewanella sp. KT0246]|uniref:DEAD/DEAH box helicase family protein n=1 Tax=Shewanella sp. KT0246 TaxID=2815912 RepID=UPI001BBA435C|nr:DEAD/DEAH box helicase family protein [Shewanella sp. KT0246]GIU51817.1 hypothetical protein TUM4249_18430 [Shewanella sp. KT0246]
MNLTAFNNSSWVAIEKHLEAIDSNKQKGDLFEYFTYFYLKYFSKLHAIDEIYCPIVDGKSFPAKVINKLKLENTDNGVDGVYINNKGEYIAWQAKFRSKRAALTATELSTFWAEAEYADHRLIISNSKKLTKVANKKSGHLSLLSDKFEVLDEHFFTQLHDFFTTKNKKIVIDKKVPRDYQEKIVEDIREGFSTSNKGKVIAACGIGKTLISIWSAEAVKAKRVIFFAPSLQLVRQTLEAWSFESSSTFSYLCVCSDQSVDSDIDKNNIDLDDIDIPVTTNPKEIANFLSLKNQEECVYIFSTYQSAEVIGTAIESLDDWTFDLAVYDEAHRTAGIGADSKFSKALLDALIPTRKKLFLTATERLIRPRLSNAANELGKAVFSMNDANVYGPTFSRLTFGEAIHKKIISDYRIVFSGITNSDLSRIISNNQYIKDELSDEQQTEAIHNLFKRTILKKTILDLGVRKVITFHSKISEAVEFSKKLNEELISNDPKDDIAISHINGQMSSQARCEIINDFEASDIGVISNVRCLTEGIDIPLIDAVFFADPKGSLIDIVQAIGRALRQKFGQENKTAYIIIPVLIDDESSDICTGQGFESLFNLIQALRDQDQELSEWIDSINSDKVRGRKQSKGNLGKIDVILPKEIDISQFEESLAIRIADVNKDPTGTIGVGGQLGKSERKGSITRVFKTAVDFTASVCLENLVEPTLNLMLPNQTYTRKDLIIYTKNNRPSNNNVSHCERLGIIKKVAKAQFQLTGIGEKIKSNQHDFNDMFKNQMMLFSQDKDGSTLFPYREVFLFLKRLKSINFVQFVYGIYSIEFDDDDKPNIEKAISNAQEINQNYPNIHLTSEANKQGILNELNEAYNCNFSFANVWTDRTTVGNQYRYLKNDLIIFDEIFTFSNKCILLKDGGEEKISEILSRSGAFLSPELYGEKIWINE